MTNRVCRVIGGLVCRFGPRQSSAKKRDNGRTDWCSMIIDTRVLCVVILFFFSSRRRHTRYWRDWSSDVCSSDLGPMQATYQAMQTWRQAYARTADDAWLAPIRRAEDFIARKAASWEGKPEGVYLDRKSVV